MPTGAGKTCVAAEVARLHRGRTVVVCHRRELVEPTHRLPLSRQARPLHDGDRRGIVMWGVLAAVLARRGKRATWVSSSSTPSSANAGVVNMSTPWPMYPSRASSVWPASKEMGSASSSKL